MEEFEINLVGNDEEIKNEEIFNDFDFNYVPINNLPISYFPLNNGLLFNELKKINNEILDSGIALTEITDEQGLVNKLLTINASNSPYTILVKKNIDCELNLSGTWKNIRLNKGIYTIIFNFNKYNIIEKNKKEIYKELTTGPTSILLKFNKNNTFPYIKKLSGNKEKSIDISVSTTFSIETALDNPNYKLLVYRTIGSGNTLKLNKDITCDILLVGGGGGGGLNIHEEGGGGGGGGGVGMGTITLKSGTYTITIGSGGNGGTINANNGTDGSKGENTIILSTLVVLTANGGGAGGVDNGENGGSGGGGSGHTQNRIGGTAEKGSKVPDHQQITFYGNNGGASHHNSGGGGGGGAGSMGNSILNGNKNGGNGGNGIVSTITGMPIYYGGGGGGASANGSNIDKTGGTGGIGGGGNGGNRDKQLDGENGKDYIGGGGGGSSLGNAGKGGSGIVIIRVKKEDLEDDVNINEILTSTDTRIINEINNVLDKKMIEFNNDEKPYNYLGILPLIILIIIIWIFIFLFLLKFVHHYFASIYLYILLFIIIFLLIFGSLWFLYTNNDIL